MSSSQGSIVLNSPKQANISKSQEKKENIEDTLTKPLKRLDQAPIISTVDLESRRLSEFDAEFSDMLLSAMLEVRAWALTRPASEQEATEDALEIQLAEIRTIQDEQEQTRLRLLNFIKSIKSALAALTTGI